METEILRVQNLSAVRKYGCDLERIYMNLYEGEVLGIVGFHNSGKSFLSDCLCGKAKPGQGRIFFYEEPTDASTWKGSDKIARIWQKSALVDHMSVTENIFVIRKRRQIFIPWNGIRKETENCLNEFDVSMNPDTKISDLTRIEKHIIELLRAYVTGAKLILIDDIMHSYTEEEYDEICRIIRKMQHKGLSFIISGCHLENMQRLAQRCVFMVNGHIVKMIENMKRKQIDDMRIMLGDVLREKVRRQLPKKNGSVLFEADRFRVRRNKELSFKLTEGEIGVFFDPFFQSRETLIRAIREGTESETLWIAGKPLKKNKANVVVADFVTDRMVIERLSIRDNLCLSSFPRISRMGFICSRKAETVERLFREEYAAEKMVFGEMTEQMDFAQNVAIYLERLKLRKWDVMFCINLENVMDYKIENIILRQFEEMANKGRAICICSSAVGKFSGLADSYYIVLSNGIVQKMSYGEMIKYFEI